MFTSKKIARKVFSSIRAEIAAMTVAEILEWDSKIYCGEWMSVREQWKQRLIRKQVNILIDLWQGPIMVEIYDGSDAKMGEPVEPSELQRILDNALNG